MMGLSPRERFLNACRRLPVDRPPIWMMRQAGRYLPEYREIQEKLPTLQMMKDPATACEITLQPVRRLGVDAAILYSDILILPEAMGLKLQMIKGDGPRFAQPVASLRDVEQLQQNGATACDFVYRAIEEIRKKIGKGFPLIGFAGAPWTVVHYMTTGPEGSRIQELARSSEETFLQLMKKITAATIDYLKRQIEAGVDCVQLFDTWAGQLSLGDYQRWALPFEREILLAIRETGVPTILYIKGGGEFLENLIKIGASVISIDHETDLREARNFFQDKVALQGNLDPEVLLKSPVEIEKSVEKMIGDWGRGWGYIINLGHGILKETPVENALAFVKAAQRLGVKTIL